MSQIETPPDGQIAIRRRSSVPKAWRPGWCNTHNLADLRWALPVDDRTGGRYLP